MNNYRPELPNSLKKLRTRKILIRLFSCFLLFSGLLYAIIRWGDALFPIREKYYVFRISLYLVFLVLPFVVSGVPKKLIDTSWSGIVVAVGVEENTGSYFVGARIWPYPRNNLVLTVKKDNGKTIDYTIMSLGIKNSPWNSVPVVGKIEYQTEKFQIGDRVHKYYGYKHLFVEHIDSRSCIVCGSFNSINNENCWCCSSNLLK